MVQGMLRYVHCDSPSQRPDLSRLMVKRYSMRQHGLEESQSVWALDDAPKTLSIEQLSVIPFFQDTHGTRGLPTGT
jgi:hypothetical protein